MISTRRSAGLMADWLDGFHRSLQTVKFLPHAHYLREQMTISALALANYDSFHELPITYNYQVQNHGHFSARGTSPEDAVLWHYQPYFNKVFRKFGARVENEKRIAGKIALAEQFVDKIYNNYSKMIGIDESVLNVIKKKLNIGNRARFIINQFK